jgi:hypothetical protein
VHSALKVRVSVFLQPAFEIFFALTNVWRVTLQMSAITQAAAVAVVVVVVVSYLTSYSTETIQRRTVGWIRNSELERIGPKRAWTKRGTIRKCACRDWTKPWRISVRSAGDLGEIRTEYLSNTSPTTLPLCHHIKNPLLLPDFDPNRNALKTRQKYRGVDSRWGQRIFQLT